MHDMIREIGKLLGHSDGVFPKECALKLLDLVRRKALLDNILVTLSCVLPIAAWAVDWAINDDDKFVAMDSEPWEIASQITSEMDSNVTFATGEQAEPRAIAQTYRMIAAEVLRDIGVRNDRGAILGEVRSAARELAKG